MSPLANVKALKDDEIECHHLTVPLNSTARIFHARFSRVLIEGFADQLADYIYAGITHNKESNEHFLQQAKVYASKPGFHLRRTAKLDPIAEFFLYDLVYRNRASFKKSMKKNRLNFGYRFENGKAISPAASYRAFKSDVHKAIEKYKYCVKCDISRLAILVICNRRKGGEESKPKSFIGIFCKWEQDECSNCQLRQEDLKAT